jgi:hypothetical protein
MPAARPYRALSVSHPSVRRCVFLALGFLGCVGVVVTVLSLELLVFVGLFAVVNNSS